MTAVETPIGRVDVKGKAQTVGTIKTVPINERHPLADIPVSKWEDERVRNVADVLVSMWHRHRSGGTDEQE